MNDFSNKHPIILVVGFIAYFICLWSGIVFFLAFLGGWRTLAKRFRHSLPFAGQIWRGQSGKMRWLARYRNCLTVGVDGSGLLLRTMFLFRVGHPALLIPWEEIAIRKRGKLLFFRYVELRLGRDQQIPLIIGADLTAKIQAEAGVKWPVETTT